MDQPLGAFVKMQTPEPDTTSCQLGAQVVQDYSLKDPAALVTLPGSPWIPSAASFGLHPSGARTSLSSSLSFLLALGISGQDHS